MWVLPSSSVRRFAKPVFDFTISNTEEFQHEALTGSLLLNSS